MLAGNVQQSQRTNNRRAAQQDSKNVRKSNECISLRDLRPGTGGIEHHQVVIERPIIEESEPFIQHQNIEAKNGSNVNK